MAFSLSHKPTEGDHFEDLLGSLLGSLLASFFGSFLKIFLMKPMGCLNNRTKLTVTGEKASSPLEATPGNIADNNRESSAEAFVLTCTTYEAYSWNVLRDRLRYSGSLRDLEERPSNLIGAGFEVSIFSHLSVEAILQEDSFRTFEYRPSGSVSYREGNEWWPFPAGAMVKGSYGIRMVIGSSASAQAASVFTSGSDMERFHMF